MGLIPRLKARLGSLLAPAEDPRSSSGSVYRRQGDLLARLEAALVEIAASKRRLQAQIAAADARLLALTEQVRAALRAGREDLARLHIARRRELAAELGRMASQAEEAGQEEERLRIARQRLVSEMEALRTKQEVVSARYTAAEAQVRVNEALAGVSTNLNDFG